MSSLGVPEYSLCLTTIAKMAEQGLIDQTQKVNLKSLLFLDYRLIIEAVQRSRGDEQNLRVKL